MKDHDDSGDVNVTEAERRRIARIHAAHEWARRIESAVAIAAQPADVIAWDVAGMLPCDDAPALIFGPPASFKSWLGLHLCDCVVSGRAFLGLHDVRKRPKALYVNIDAGPKTFRNRVRRIGATPGLDFISLSAMDFADIGLRELLARYRDGFVVLDCLSAIYNPPRGDDPAYSMRAFVDGLRNDFEAAGCGGAVLDHPHRPKEVGSEGDYFGSIQKEAAFRTMWQVNAEAKEPGQPGRTKIACRKISEGEPFALVRAAIDFSDDRIAFSTSDNATEQSGGSTKVRTAVLAWAKKRGPVPFSKQNAKDAIKFGNGPISTCIDELSATKLLIVVGVRGGAPIFTHPDFDPTQPGLGQP